MATKRYMEHNFSLSLFIAYLVSSWNIIALLKKLEALKKKLLVEHRNTSIKKNDSPPKQNYKSETYNFPPVIINAFFWGIETAQLAKGEANILGNGNTTFELLGYQTSLIVLVLLLKTIKLLGSSASDWVNPPRRYT